MKILKHFDSNKYTAIVVLSIYHKQSKIYFLVTIKQV